MPSLLIYFTFVFMAGIDVLYTWEFKNICYNIANPKSIYRDLHQESILTILEKGFKIHEIPDEQKRYFFAAVAYQTFRGSGFKKKYQYELNLNNVPFNDNMAVKSENYDTTIDKKIESVIKEYIRAKETDKEEYLDLLFRRYMECGQSSYVVSDTYNIPRRTVSNSISEYRQKFKYIYAAAGKD